MLVGNTLEARATARTGACTPPVDRCYNRLRPVVRDTEELGAPAGRLRRHLVAVRPGDRIPVDLRHLDRVEPLDIDAPGEADAPWPKVIGDMVVGGT